MSEKFSTAAVRNWPKVVLPGVAEAVVKDGHQRSISGSPAFRLPPRLNTIGPVKLPAPAVLLLPKLAMMTSSADPPVKLPDVGAVNTLSVVLATSWSKEPWGIGVLPLLVNNSAAPKLIVTE